MSQSIFLVLMTQGLHSDRAVSPIRSYLREDRAKGFCDEQNKLIHETEVKVEVFGALLAAWDDLNPSPPYYGEGTVHATDSYKEHPSHAYQAWEDRRAAEYTRLSRAIFQKDVIPDVDSVRYYYVKVDHDDSDLPYGGWIP